jgi:hypothetical protein
VNLGGNMPDILASDFTGVLTVFSQNDELRNAALNLIANQPMPGKVTEGEGRLEKFRVILTDLVNGQINLTEAYVRTSVDLPRQASPHSGNNRVFPDGWEERLVRTQLSRFYNQAVMEKLLSEGENQCFVPHSSAEASDSACSIHLAGSNHDLKTLYNRLVDSYTNGKWIQDVKIPNHPHCTHVVSRAE